MSATIDERIVSMSFDNTNFETNVADSMTTLDKLKSLLSNLDGRGLDSISKSASNVDLTPISAAAGKVQDSFNGMQIAMATTIAKITSDVYDEATKIADALTLKPAREGFSEYETQINAVQTIMSNTGLGVDEVNKGLDKLNEYADLTIYNFSQMVDAAGKFTAAGIDYNTTLQDMQGIGNWAAASGTDAQTMARLLTQISQALSSGSFMLQDWRSIENSPMSGKKYRDAFVKNAKAYYESAKAFNGTDEEFNKQFKNINREDVDVYLGLLEEIQNGKKKFRDTLKEGWFTSDIFDITMKQFAEDKDMLDAATKVKTFTQLMDTLGEALGSGWTQSWRIVVGDFEEARELFTGIFEALGKIIDNSSDARNKILQDWSDLGGREELINAGKNIGTALLDIGGAIKSAFTDVFGTFEGSDLEHITKAIENFSESLKPSEETVQKLHDVFEKIFDIVKRILDTIGKIGKPIVDIFKGVTPEVGKTLLDLFDKFLTGIQDLADALKSASIIEKAFQRISDAYKTLKDSLGQQFNTNGTNLIIELGKSLGGLAKEGIQAGFNLMQGILQGLHQALVDGTFKDTLDMLGSTMGSVLIFDLIKSLSANGGASLGEALKGLLEPLIGNFKSTSGGLKEALDSLKETFESYQKDLLPPRLIAIAIAIHEMAKGIEILSKCESGRVEEAALALGILFAEIAGALSVTLSPAALENSGWGQSIQTVIVIAGIAKAGAILAESVSELAKYDLDQLGNAMLGLSVIMSELIIAYAIVNKINATGGGVAKGIAGAFALVKFAEACVIVVDAVKGLADIPNMDKLGQGLAGVSTIIAELTITYGLMLALSDKFSSKILGGFKSIVSAASFVILAQAVKMMVEPIKELSKLNSNELGWALAGVAGVVAIFEEFLVISKFTGPIRSIMNGGATILLAVAINALVPAIKAFCELSKDSSTLGTAIGVIDVLLTTLVVFSKAMTGSVLTAFGSGGAVIVMSLGLMALEKALEPYSKMSRTELGALLGTLVIELIALGSAMLVMNKGIVGAAAMVIASTAILILAKACKEIQKLDIIETAKGLGLLGGALVGLAVITAGLSGLAAPMLTFAGALAAVGGALLLLGAAIGVFEADAANLDLTNMTKALDVSAWANAIKDVGGAAGGLFEGLLKGIEYVLDNLIGWFFGAAGDLAAVIVKFIGDILDTLDKYIKPIGTKLCDIIIKIIDIIGEKAPELVHHGTETIKKIVDAIIDEFSGMDGSAMENAAKVFIGATVFVKLLSGLTSFIPTAMIAVVGLGLLVAEIAAVIAAIGLLNKIPGFTDMVNSGGEVLGAVGSAIGNFIGGLIGAMVGGTIAVASEYLPIVGASLSAFYTNAEPFFNGVKNIGADTISSVKDLAEALLIICGAEVLDSILSFVSGGSENLAVFGVRLSSFGDAMAAFQESVAGIDPELIRPAAKAGILIAKMADEIPNSGGLLGLFAGENDLDAFGDQLIAYGEGVAGFCRSIEGVKIDAKQIDAMASATSSIVKMAGELPNSGGLAGLLAGDNDLDVFGERLATFGTHIVEYCDKVKGIDMTKTGDIVTSIQRLSSMANTVGFNKLSTISDKLTSFATSYTKAIKKINDSDFDDEATQFGDSLSKVKVDSSSLTGQFKQAGTESVKALRDSFNTQFDAFKKTLPSKMGTAGSACKLARGDFYSAGSYCVQGFANGISENTWAAEAKARAMASAALTAAKRKLEEKSPSRATYRFGDYFVQGFANGVSENTKRATEAARDMAGSSLDVLSKAVNEANDLAMSGVDTNPTITPIVDLSDVKDKTGTLAKMMNEATSVGTTKINGINGSLLNDTYNNRMLQNAMSDIALRMDDNNSASGDTYIIDGITYDDGTAVSNAVGELIHAAKMERRK